MVAPDVAALHATRYTIPMVPADHPIRARFSDNFDDIHVVYILRRTRGDGWVISTPFEQRGCWSEQLDRFVDRYDFGEDRDEYLRHILYPHLDAAWWRAEQVAAIGLAELEEVSRERGFLPAPVTG